MKKLISVLLVIIMTVTLFPLTGAAAETTETKITGIPVISQWPNLPTGCEATSLTMLLNFFGTNLTKEQVANIQPSGPNLYRVNGVLYGADPNKEFIGSPYDSNSLGIYYQPFIPIVEAYFPNRSENLSGGLVSKLYNTIDSGRPVLVWASVGMMQVTPGIKWTLEDGTVFQWKNGNHALLLVGYTDTQVIMNDPWTGKEEYYNKAVFEDRWTAMGKQALTVKAEIVKTPSIYYDDVFEEDWYFSIINEMTVMGIVCGYGDRTFRPMNDCTYGEFIKLTKDMMYQKTFPNNSGEWYDPIAEESINNAIMTEVNKYTDTEDGTYLNKPILRKEVAQILFVLLSDEEIITQLKARMASLYKDTSDLNQEELAAFAFVEDAGIIYGNNFEMNPEEPLTRTEVLIIRKRVMENDTVS